MSSQRRQPRCQILKDEEVLLDRKGGHARQRNCVFEGLAPGGEVLCYCNTWTKRSGWGIIIRRRQIYCKYQIMKICAKPFGGLLAQNEETVKICNEATALFFASGEGSWANTL